MPWVILANDKYKIAWDIYIMFILINTTVFVPYRLAFIDQEEIGWTTTYYCIDALFFVDIILWFFTSYTDSYKQ